ncbi:MAG: glycosyl hydrolase family 28 protein [Paludibacter sp.]|nr:glycosyl hydrolase family 28 protein [Paludibacter sp.]
MKKHTILIIFSILFSFCASELQAAITLPNIPSTQFPITNYGALTSSLDNSTAINAAITAANTAGGGMVVIPAGTFLSGPITMKSNVNLYLSKGAILQLMPYGTGNGTPAGSYPNNGTADAYANFIYGQNLSNIKISGTGAIEGNGTAWWAAYKANTAISRPCMIRFKACNTVQIDSVTLRNAPNVHLTLGQSGSSNGSNGTISNVTISAPSTSPNTDAIDTWYWNGIDIRNCNLSVGDDNVAMNNYSKNLTIHKCTMGTGHGISVGSYTIDVQNVSVDSCTFSGTTNGIRLKSNITRGGNDSTFTYSNITMNNVKYPFYITSWYDNEPYPASSQVAGTVVSLTPIFKNITFKNITVTNATYGGIIYGLPEMPIKNVVFDNVKIAATTGGLVANYITGLQFKNCSSITIPSSKGNALVSQASVTSGTPYSVTSSGINLTSGASTSCTSAVDDVQVNETLSCFPNPLQGDYLTVKSDIGISKVRIYSLTGVRLKELTGDGSAQLQVNLSEVGAGCYVMNVIFSNNTTSSRKLIKE